MSDPFIYSPVKIIITVLAAFLPAIIYSIIIRYSEKYEREPWGSIGQAFMWGGTLSIVLVILIRGFFRVDFLPNYPDISSDEQISRLLIICLITPVIAEIIKPMGLLLVKSDILEAEDGLIYGAVIGCGYTATENLMFGIYLAPLYGVDLFVTVVIVRSMSVMFIQSSTTALTCYGITRAMKVKHKAGSFFAFPAFLLAAIAIHATFNYLVYMNMFNYGEVNIIVSISSGVLFSVIFALLLMFIIYFKIYRLDREDKREEEKRQKEETERWTPLDRGWPEARDEPRPRMGPRDRQHAGPRARPGPRPRTRTRPQGRPQPPRPPPAQVRASRADYYDYPDEYGYNHDYNHDYGPGPRPRPSARPPMRHLNAHYEQPNYSNNPPLQGPAPRPPGRQSGQIKTTIAQEPSISTGSKKAQKTVTKKIGKKEKIPNEKSTDELEEKPGSVSGIKIIRPPKPGQVPAEDEKTKGPRPIMVSSGTGSNEDQDLDEDSEEIEVYDEGEADDEEAGEEEGDDEMEVDWDE